MDLHDYNARWLKAWSTKDVDGLMTFYSDDVLYKDPQTAAGLLGGAALRAYLTGLFQATPPIEYVPDEVWPLAGGGGYAGRWIATMDLGEGKRKRFRGFDLVLMDGDRITLNEVYTHDLAE
ncbi:MAG: nuclear transport factor 2 family protein [Dehalococcoidia bacterium]